MFTKNELGFVITLLFVLMMIFVVLSGTKAAEVDGYKAYFNQATDVCKNEYIDYNIDVYGGRR